MIEASFEGPAALLGRDPANAGSRLDLRGASSDRHIGINDTTKRANRDPGGPTESRAFTDEGRAAIMGV
jgi:hypothetical protein